MRKNRRNSGFTLLELLIVVLVIGVLSGVAISVVNNRQRSLTQLEEDAVAKEIFVAAQNHLTMARNEGYLGASGAQYGLPGGTAADTKDPADPTNTTDKKIYYYTVDGGVTTPTGAGMMSNLMLPLGSVDETVRQGSYIVRYQPDSGLVLDVFYWKPAAGTSGVASRFTHTAADRDYTDLMQMVYDGNGKLIDNSRHGLLNFGSDNAVVGWYGGQEAEALPQLEAPLVAPALQVSNGAKLQVKVTDNNDPDKRPGGYVLKLVVKGESSGAQKAFDLTAGGDSRVVGSVDNKEYSVILDDITTSGRHFVDLNDGTNNFIPGENITVQAVCFTNSAIGNIGYSDVETTNSLFEKIETRGTDTAKYDTVSVNNMRHLENMDRTISGFVYNETAAVSTAKSLNIQNAVQTTDMSWPGYKSLNGTNITIFKKDGTSGEVDKYLPVNPDYDLTYDGGHYSISGVVSSVAAPVGLFGEPKDATSAKALNVSNLALIDFKMTTTSGEAGALAGKLGAASTITNVVAYNTKAFNDSTAKLTATVTATGDVGGLIGQATGCTVKKCAAALTVTTSGGNAGGLIGSTSGGNIDGSYSGGHTNEGTFFAADKTPIYNVTGAGTGKYAGGLIGNAGDTQITHSYSTCSVTGPSAGGFVGKSTASITNCYATGLVWGPETTDTATVDTTIKGKPAKLTLPKVGAFAYSATGPLTGCKYYEIINERYLVSTGTSAEPKYKLVSTLGTTAEGKPEKGEFFYLAPLGGNGNQGGIGQLDADETAYNTFVGADSDWKDAWVYDSKLIEYYGAGTTDKTARFNLETVAKLGATVKTEDEKNAEGKVTALADFVATHYGDWPAPEIFVFNS